MQHTMTQTDAPGLAAGYDDTPSTFAPVVAPVPQLPMATACQPMEQQWSSGVAAANTLHAYIGQQADAARAAARNHLFGALSLGCLLTRMKAAAASNGVPIAALFSDFNGNPGARAAASKLTAGVLFNFTSRTARNYVKLYDEHAGRIAAASTPEEASRLLADHAAALVAGAYGENAAAEIAQLWLPYVTADNLRQAYLELAPARPAANIAEEAAKVQDEQPKEGFADWEAQRAKLCTDFGGLFANLDTLIGSSSNMHSQDREAMADKLEAAARRLRATKTQRNLPGLEASAQQASTINPAAAQ